MARRSRKRAGKEHLDGSPNHQEAQEQPTAVNAEKPQLLNPETESTFSKDPEIKIVDEREVKKVEVEERNEPNQFRNEPDSTPAEEMITKSVSDLDSEHHDLCPKLDPLSPKKTNPVLLPVNETNGLSTEPDSTTSRKKRKKKGKSLSSIEGTKTNNVHFEHRELIPNLDPFCRKDLDPVLLPEPEPVFVKNDTNGLPPEPDSTTSRKKNGKSLSSIEGTEANNVHFEHHELTPNVDPLSPKDSDPVLLPEPEPVAEKNETNQICTEPESATPRKKKRKRKGKSLSTGKVTETSNVHLERRESVTNLDPLFPKDSDPILLPEPEPVAEKNEINQLCTEQESATGRKKRKRKGKSISTSEVIETNFVHFEHRESIPNLDPLPPKDYSSLLLELEPVAEKNESNQLCTEKEPVTPRKKKRKRKGNSMSMSEGVEANHVDSEHHVPCRNLAALPSKDQDLLLLTEPGLVGEKNEASQLCTKPDSTSPKFEREDIKNMDPENLKLCPELDPSTLKHPDPLLLPESDPASVKEVEQKKKKKEKKKKKNKGELEGDGAEAKRPSNGPSQKCHKAKPKTLEEQNQRKRKRQAMNDVWYYNIRPRRATILNSEAVGQGPWIPKRPLKDYECYERCLGCGLLCQSGQSCRRKLPKNSPTCFFCGTSGHLLRTCPLSPGAKCANGIVMLDDFVRKECCRRSKRTKQQVAPANVPTLPSPDLYAVAPANVPTLPSPDLYAY